MLRKRDFRKCLQKEKAKMYKKLKKESFILPPQKSLPIDIVNNIFVTRDSATPFWAPTLAHVKNSIGKFDGKKMRLPKIDSDSKEPFKWREKGKLHKPLVIKLCTHLIFQQTKCLPFFSTQDVTTDYCKLILSITAPELLKKIYDDNTPTQLIAHTTSDRHKNAFVKNFYSFDRSIHTLYMRYLNLFIKSEKVNKKMLNLEYFISMVMNYKISTLKVDDPPTANALKDLQEHFKDVTAGVYFKDHFSYYSGRIALNMIETKYRDPEDTTDFFVDAKRAYFTRIIKETIRKSTKKTTIAFESTSFEANRRKLISVDRKTNQSKSNSLRTFYIKRATNDISETLVGIMIRDFGWIWDGENLRDRDGTSQCNLTNLSQGYRDVISKRKQINLFIMKSKESINDNQTEMKRSIIEYYDSQLKDEKIIPNCFSNSRIAGYKRDTNSLNMIKALNKNIEEVVKDKCREFFYVFLKNNLERIFKSARAEKIVPNYDDCRNEFKVELRQNMLASNEYLKAIIRTCGGILGKRLYAKVVLTISRMFMNDEKVISTYQKKYYEAVVKAFESERNRYVLQRTAEFDDPSTEEAKKQIKIITEEFQNRFKIYLDMKAINDKKERIGKAAFDFELITMAPLHHDDYIDADMADDMSMLGGGEKKIEVGDIGAMRNQEQIFDKIKPRVGQYIMEYELELLMDYLWGLKDTMISVSIDNTKALLIDVFNECVAFKVDLTGEENKMGNIQREYVVLEVADMFSKLMKESGDFFNIDESLRIISLGICIDEEDDVFLGNRLVRGGRVSDVLVASKTIPKEIREICGNVKPPQGLTQKLWSGSPGIKVAANYRKNFQSDRFLMIYDSLIRVTALANNITINTDFDNKFPLSNHAIFKHIINLDAALFNTDVFLSGLTDNENLFAVSGGAG